MKIKEFGETAESLIDGNMAIEVFVDDRLSGEYYKVDELAIDTERRNLFIVVNTEASERAKPKPSIAGVCLACGNEYNMLQTRSNDDGWCGRCDREAFV